MASVTNISTWSSADYQSATATQIASLTNEQVKSMAHPDWLLPAAIAGFTASQVPSINISWGYMNATWLDALSPSAFAAIPATGVTQFSSTAIAGLDVAHTQALTVVQLDALSVGKLSTTSMAALTSAQLTGMAATKWGSFSATQLNALTLEQFAAVPAAGVAKFSRSATAGLDVRHVQTLTVDQMKGLYYPEALSLAAVAALAPAQVAAISTSFYWMSASWLNAMAPAALAAITTKGIGQLAGTAIAGLDAAHTQALTATQLNALSVGSLSTTSMAALTPDQLSGMSASKWSGFSAVQLNAIPVASFATIAAASVAKFSSSACAGLDVAHVQALTAVQMAALYYPEKLSLAAVAALAPAQVAAISTSFYWMGADWLNAMTPAAFAAITTKGIGQLSSTAIAGLDPAHLQSLTSAQLNVISLSSLTGTQIATLSGTQLASIGLDRWYWLSASWLNSIPVDTFKTLPAAIVAKFSGTAVSGLDLPHVAALTVDQMKTLSSPEKLSLAAVATLTPAQVAAIGGSFYWMSADWLNALSPTATAAISTTSLGQIFPTALSGLDAAHVSALSATQINAIWCLGSLNSSAIGALSASQLSLQSTSFWYWAKPDWLNALSTSTWAGLSTTAISSLTSANVALLDASHIGAMTATQVAALGYWQRLALTPAQMGSFSAAAISGFSTSALDDLSAAQIAGLTAVQTAGLSTTQIASLSYTQLAALSTSAASAFSPAQLAAVGTNIGALSVASIAALSVSTVQSMSFMQLSALEPAQIAAMSQQQLASLSSAQVNYLTPGQLAALDGHVQWLSTSAITGLNNVNLISVYASLSSTQLSALTVAQKATVSQAGTVVAGLLQNLSSDGIRTQVEAVINSGESLFSYESLLEVLQAVDVTVGSSGLTQAQMNDLKTLVAAVGQSVGTDSYLYEITSNVVNGNKSNAYWTGGAAASVTLGNLAVGSSAWQLDHLIDKWFLGEDLPTWTGSTAYTSFDAPLFSASGPLASEVSQGGIGDCYMLAALVDVADDYSSLLESMFTDNGNGTYGIRFYGVNDDPLYVTVNSVLPGGWGRATASSGSLWVSLIEKAYVEYEVQVYNEVNAYASISGGWDGGMLAIAGRSSQYYSASSITLSTWTTTTKATVINALNNGQEVMLSSNITLVDVDNGKTDLVPSHMFAVLGYDVAKDELILRNPWGSAGGNSWNGVFDLKFEEMWAAGNGLLVTTEASPTGAIDAKYAVNSVNQLLQAMATEGGVSAADTSVSSSNPLMDNVQITLVTAA